MERVELPLGTKDRARRSVGEERAGASRKDGSWHTPIPSSAWAARGRPPAVSGPDARQDSARAGGGQRHRADEEGYAVGGPTGRPEGSVRAGWLDRRGRPAPLVEGRGGV